MMVKYATLTNFAFIMVSKFVCPDVRRDAEQQRQRQLPGNGSDKKDDKNDKKARLPKSVANVKASTATNQPRTCQTKKTENKTMLKTEKRNE